MDLKEIVSISGLGGLYKVVGQRTNGIIVESLVDGSKKFITNQQNTATSLENISIYDDDEGVLLGEVFSRMYEKKTTNDPAAALKGSADDLWTYMELIIPKYDKERVYASDVKKMIKWYLILDETGILEKALEEAKKEAKKNVDTKAKSSKKVDKAEEQESKESKAEA